MVHEVEVTEESSVLAACHKPEVRVVAAIRDYESAAVVKSQGTGSTWASAGVLLKPSIASRSTPVKSPVISIGTIVFVLLSIVFPRFA
jgi:hypothetical protein